MAHEGPRYRRNETNERSGRVLTFSTRRELSKKSAAQSLGSFELSTGPTAPTVANVACLCARQVPLIRGSNVKPLI